MNYRLLSEARGELDSAIAYYESKRQGLGIEFWAAIHSIVARIVENPRQFPRVSRRLRKAGLRRFPYGVIYQDQVNDLLIVAIAHGRRKPGYWKARLK